MHRNDARPWNPTATRLADGPARADVDVAVLGAGPAGAACALRAADLGLSVLLCDPQAGGFDKPCGEGILPAGVAALRSLGIFGAAARPFPGLRHRVPGAGALEIELAAAGEAWWRTDLHAALSAAVAARSRILRVPARAEARRHAGGFLVAADDCAWQAAALVVADGAGGRALPAERQSRRPAARRHGARIRCEERGRLDRVEVHFGRGWDVYLTPLPRGAVNVVVLHDFPDAPTDAAPAWIEAGLSAHPAAREHLGAALGRAESRALGWRPPRRCAQEGAFLVGDAGGAIDPILGAGLTVALRTGIQAAESAAALRAGVPALRVAQDFHAAARAERRARQAMAAGLRFLSTHDLLARWTLRGLRATPALAQRLAAIAAGASASPRASGATRAPVPLLPQ